MVHRSLNFASLFSGCGGFDLGFRQVGFRSLAAFDHDADAIANFRRNLGDQAFVRDLTYGVPSDHRLKETDVLIAGPPCQGFSTVGKRRLDDDRNQLLTLTGTLAKRLSPRVVIVENVAGVIAGEHARYWNILIGTLRAVGYRTHQVSCQAAQLGMAQIRRRIFLLAWRTAREVRFELPMCPPGDLRSVLRGVSGLPNHNPQDLDPDTDICRIAMRIGQGQKLSNVRGGNRSVHTWDIPEVFGRTTKSERTLLELLLRLRRQNRARSYGDADPVSIERLSVAFGEPFRKLLKSLLRKGYVCYKGELLDLVHTFNGKFRRLAWDSPSCTVDTRFGEPRYFLHPDKDRGLTVREAARIQGFPDDFIFEGDMRTKYRLVGNAVPPPMARMTAIFARHLLGCM